MDLIEHENLDIDSPQEAERDLLEFDHRGARVLRGAQRGQDLRV